MMSRPVINDQGYADEREANVEAFKRRVKELVDGAGGEVEFVMDALVEAADDFAEAERDRRNGYDRAYEASMPREG